MAQKTSIKIKKFWYSDLAPDGGLGTAWKEIQQGQREATVQFNGSDADTTNYKNVLGGTLQSQTVKGDKTMNFQFADLSASVIADFTGGTVTTDAVSTRYEAPENENNSIEKSIRFLTDTNVLFEIPRASFDGYPIVNDDDLHYYQMNSVVLTPEKSGVRSYAYDELLQPDENDILSFVLAEQTGAATIDSVLHTVAIEVANGTSVTALEPTIGVSLGASIDPNSGEAQDFTSPVVYTVESANAGSQTWTVTVTVAV